MGVNIYKLLYYIAFIYFSFVHLSRRWIPNYCWLYSLSHTHTTMKQRLGHWCVCVCTHISCCYISQVQNKIPLTNPHPPPTHTQLLHISTFVTFCYHPLGDVRADSFPPQTIYLVNSIWLSFPKDSIHSPLQPPEYYSQDLNFICTSKTLKHWAVWPPVRHYYYHHHFL